MASLPIKFEIIVVFLITIRFYANKDNIAIISKNVAKTAYLLGKLWTVSIWFIHYYMIINNQFQQVQL